MFISLNASLLGTVFKNNQIAIDSRYVLRDGFSKLSKKYDFMDIFPGIVSNWAVKQRIYLQATGSMILEIYYTAQVPKA